MVWTSLSPDSDIHQGPDRDNQWDQETRDSSRTQQRTTGLQTCHAAVDSSLVPIKMIII